MLGPPQLTCDGVGVKLQRKPLALLTYLALAEPRGFHRRDTLLGIFWPDYDQGRARTALRQSLYNLRRALGEDVILSEGEDQVGLDHDLVQCDALAFDAAIEEGQLESATSLFKGPVLQGLYLRGCPEFEYWLDGQRLPRDRAYADTVERLAAAAQERGNQRKAGEWLRRLALVDPLNGRIAVLLMNTLEAGGDRAGAIRVGEKHVAAVQRELQADAESAVMETLQRLRTEPAKIDAPELMRPRDIRRRLDLESVKEALDDRYQIIREVGSGVMAKIYLAEDRKVPRKVAVKVLRPEYASTLGPERFLKEIDIVASLTHPHIVTLLEPGEVGGFLFYVMSYIEGESLRESLLRQEYLDIGEAVRITRHVASALEYSHQRNIVHRDITPGNILLHDGEALVTDFGIALAVSQAGGRRLTESGLLLGTPEYMPPEQADSQRPIDGRADIYSLGCVLYEMLAGEPVFTGATPQAVIAKHRLERVPSVRIPRPPVSPELEQVIIRALAKIPADRFATAADFAEAVVSASDTRD